MTIDRPTGAELQAAAALLHAAEGGRMIVRLRSGRTITVGDDTNDVATACLFRRTVGELADAVALASDIVHIELGGCFTGRTGPVFHHERSDHMGYWFVTSLCPIRVEALLDRVELAIPGDAVEVRLVVDAVTGLTVGRLSIDHAVFGVYAAETAIAVAACLLVETLLGLVDQHSAIDEKS